MKNLQAGIVMQAGEDAFHCLGTAKITTASKVRWDVCRRVDITSLADAGGKLPADATRVVKPVFASPMRVQVRLLPWFACVHLLPAPSLPIAHCSAQHYQHLQSYHEKAPGLAFVRTQNLMVMKQASASRPECDALCAGEC